MNKTTLLANSSFVAAVLLLSQAALAYETPLHARITQAAFNRSVFSTDMTTLYARLGFDRLKEEHPFEDTVNGACAAGVEASVDAYVDANGDWLEGAPAPDTQNVRFRCAQPYERRLMPVNFSGRNNDVSLGTTPDLRLEAWLMRGAIREDDVGLTDYTNPELAPDADPWGDRIRVLNHFYSPVTNTSDTLFTFNGLAWAFGEADPFATPSAAPDNGRGNHFTHADARRYYFQALTYKAFSVFPSETGTRKDHATRLSLWAGTLDSLGHVVHLLQDQASPQHSRGEPHNHTCAGLSQLINTDHATRTYENYTNYRLLFLDNATLADASRETYESTNGCEEQNWLNMFAEARPRGPANPAGWFASSYPVPQFSLARKFFTTRGANDSTSASGIPLSQLNQRAGLGDYANRGFFTQAYQAGRYLSPPLLTDPAYEVTQAPPESVPGFGVLRAQEFSWRVPDSVAPGYVDVGESTGRRVPIASTSVWCELRPQGCTRGPLLTLRNYDQMADMLVPRAVAYSAGLINHFFRGKLKVEAPVDGLLSATNHGFPHTVSNGYPVCSTSITDPDFFCSAGKIYGFTRVRLKVRNDTAAIVESGSGATVPQQMQATVAAPVAGVSSGLYAVARYHRNPCYRPDLSGERTVNANGQITEPSGCAGGITRTDYQEISLSRPRVATAAELNGSTAAAMTFDFRDDPIPINATDVIIQVVYRGQLGEEADAIAVGSLDAREPSYVTLWNNTDWGACNGAWSFGSFSPPCALSGATTRTITSANLCVGSQILLSQSANPDGNLTVGQYLRAAVLMDTRTLVVRARIVFMGSAVTELYSKSVTGQIRQSQKTLVTASSPYVSEPFFSKRGRSGSFRPVPIHLISQVDAQPANDQGALDVGNLNPGFVATDLPHAATFRFPEIALSSGACPTPSP